MTPNQYCAQKILINGSDLYYSLLFIPDDIKPAVTALYAFQKEVTDIIDKCSDESVARTKLSWWHDEIQRLYKQQPRHPVTTALAAYILKHQLKQEYFHEVITSTEMDLDYNSYKTFDDLYHYCFRTSSIFQLLLLSIFGYKHTQTEDYAKHIGIAFQLMKILCNARKDISHGNLYIPLDELEHFKVSQHDLERFQTTENISALFSFQSQRIREFFEKAFSCLHTDDRHLQKQSIILVQLIQAQLNELTKDKFKVLEHHVSLPPLRKLWLAWRCNRKESRS